MPHKHIAFGLLGVLIGAMLASAAYARWPDAHSALLGNVGWLPFLVAVATLIFLGVNSRIAQRNLENTALTLDQARRAEIATRFQKGLELLQSGNVATRVGGIAVLRDVALEAPEQYWRSISAVLVNLVEAQSEILCNTIEEAFKGASQRGPTEEPVYAPAFDRTGRDVVLAVETLGLKDADLRLALERSDAIGPVALRRVALSAVSLHGLDMRHISFTLTMYPCFSARSALTLCIAA